MPDLARVLDGRDGLELRDVAVPNRPCQRRRLVRVRANPPWCCVMWITHVNPRDPNRHARRDASLTWNAVAQLNSNGRLLPTANITFAAANLTSYSYVDASRSLLASAARHPSQHRADARVLDLGPVGQPPPTWTP